MILGAASNVSTLIEKPSYSWKMIFKLERLTTVMTTMTIRRYQNKQTKKNNNKQQIWFLELHQDVTTSSDDENNYILPIILITDIDQ